MRLSSVPRVQPLNSVPRADKTGMGANSANTEPEERVAKTSPRGRRIAARLLDALVLLGLVTLLSRLFDGTTWFAVSLWVTVAYFFLLESTFGQTVGKNAVGIRVVRRDGGPPTANSIAVRNVVRIMEEPLIALIALFGSGKRHQRFGDMFAGTTVGLERASVRPHPSSLQLVYPVLWAVLGAVMVLTVHPSHPPTLGSLPSAIGGNAPTARAAATGKYLSDLQSLCRARDRQITEQPRAPIDVIAREEFRYTRQVAAVVTPPDMLGIRRSILQGRRRFDRALAAMNRRLSLPNPDQELVDALTNHVAGIATESNDRFARLGVVCRAKAG
jgi:uncharacterized RDD family membrane protein YckC